MSEVTINWSVFAPLLSALLGASVPVVLGFLLYRRQKAIDVRMQLHSEKRIVYRDFISSLVVVNDTLKPRMVEADNGEPTYSMKYDEEALQKAQLSLALVRIYASGAVFDAGKKLIQGMRATHFDEERVSVEDSGTIFDLSAEMRKDLELGLNSK